MASFSGSIRTIRELFEELEKSFVQASSYSPPPKHTARSETPPLSSLHPATTDQRLASATTVHHRLPFFTSLLPQGNIKIVIPKWVFCSQLHYYNQFIHAWVGITSWIVILNGTVLFEALKK
ncbi:hypothetical protein Pint_04672 [Pistacia integerrima]|uniref:Uncharacterized protein n=1 Tax=Pistacia integerrima TaxID=434235 RepID=A0ACC0Z0A9_9ROSI|nr:hypothetical protein Pint_04672 [Pistacia integerrima]